jgi:hypothetical protein
MDFTDKGNSAVLTGIPKNRKFHWSSSVVHWFLSMLLVRNGQKCFESATKQKVDPIEWLEYVYLNIAPDPDACLIERATGYLMCRACYRFHGSDSSRTIWECTSCGRICKKCQKNGAHSRFFKEEQVLKTRSSFQIGRAQSFKLEKMRKTVKNLVY